MTTLNCRTFALIEMNIFKSDYKSQAKNCMHIESNRVKVVWQIPIETHHELKYVMHGGMGNGLNHFDFYIPQNEGNFTTNYKNNRP